jgi:hypothetical protein
MNWIIFHCSLLLVLLILNIANNQCLQDSIANNCWIGYHLLCVLVVCACLRIL